MAGLEQLFAQNRAWAAAMTTADPEFFAELAEHQSPEHLCDARRLQREAVLSSGELGAAIDDAFGSFDAFRAHFSAAATGIQGSGWAILAWDILGQRLIIEQLYDHQGNLAAGSYPLLMLDMWEHAFYLQYKNVKADYVKAFWNVVNWADVAKRFEDARKVALG